MSGFFLGKNPRIGTLTTHPPHNTFLGFFPDPPPLIRYVHFASTIYSFLYGGYFLYLCAKVAHKNQCAQTEYKQVSAQKYVNVKMFFFSRTYVRNNQYARKRQDPFCKVTQNIFSIIILVYDGGAVEGREEERYVNSLGFDLVMFNLPFYPKQNQINQARNEKALLGEVPFKYRNLPGVLGAL